MLSQAEIDLKSGGGINGHPQRIRWTVPPPEDLKNASIPWKQVCGSPCIARLLSRKGFARAGDVHSYLQPRLKSLADPFLLPQMQIAVARILAAIDRTEKIVLFGDYDVDGVTSLALLSDMLRAFGSAAELFLPLRMEEGYGLSHESVERCLSTHAPRLLIAVDCGTSSTAEIDHLQRSGVDVIVLDHHEPKTALPKCVALVNPKIDSNCQFQYLCSAGVVFKLCHALLKTRPVADYDLKSALDLVALATVADIVPLEGENRIFVQRGSRQLAQTPRRGLRRLLQVASVRAPIGPEDIGFRLGPRLNASGRLTTAEKSLRLLVTNDETEAASLAEFLDKQNRERQEIERHTLVAAEEQIASEYDASRDAAIVVAGHGWHPGVLGIVASRISRKHHRPTVVIGFDDSGAGKGSARSIPGLHLVRALEQCAEQLEKFGGHEMAAGLSIKEEKLTVFADAFRATAHELLSPDDLERHLRLDHELSLAELSLEFLHWHELLQPFGNANPQPLFLARDVAPVAPPRVVNEKHLLLNLRQRGAYRRAVYFDGAVEPLPPAPWDIAFRVYPDDYNGERLVRLQIHALRSTASVV